MREGGEVGADDPLLPSGRAHANRTFESRVHNENRRRVMLACVALVLAPLFPGFAIANKWSWPSSSVLVVYSIVSGGICFFLVWRVDLAPNAGGLGGAELAEGGPFSTPYARITATLALVANSYLLSQRPFEGWVRLLGISAIICGSYVISKCRSNETHLASESVN